MKTTTMIAAVVVVAGAAGWYFFVASPEQKRGARIAGELVQSKAKRAGGAILEGGSGIKTAGSESTSQEQRNAEICRGNIRRIELAKRAAAQQKGIPAGDVPLADVLMELKMPALPKCPSGGHYVLGPVNTTVRCTIGGNGTADPKDDHLVSGL